MSNRTRTRYNGHKLRGTSLELQEILAKLMDEKVIPISTSYATSDIKRARLVLDNLLLGASLVKNELKSVEKVSKDIDEL